jgi:Fe-S-cluster containining protein
MTGEDEFCIVYKSTSEDGVSGYCSEYKNRGMICRVFASTARVNKEGKKELITCKKIKEEKRVDYKTASLRINDDLDVPLASAAYQRLVGIDFDLTREQFPINQAIKRALEAVLRFQYYQEFQD